MGVPKSHRAIAAACAWIAAAAGARAAPIGVHIDENTIVDLRAPAGSVVVGNPSIADVNLITPQRMTVLGRSYGVTNILVMDRMGRLIFRGEVDVAAAPTGRVSLYRGPQVYDFACSPHCERTPMPGEDKPVYDNNGTPYKDYDDRSKTDSGAQAPALGGGS